MKLYNTVDVAGRGKIVIAEYEEGDTLHKVGDQIWYDNSLWTITGIEAKRLLTNPSRLSPHVGLVIREEK